MKRRSKTRKGGGVLDYFSSKDPNEQSLTDQLKSYVPFMSDKSPITGGRRRHRKSIKRIFGFKLQMPKLFSKTRKHRRRYSRKR
jgi:hypothetical protein